MRSPALGAKSRLAALRSKGSRIARGAMNACPEAAIAPGSAGSGRRSSLNTDLVPQPRNALAPLAILDRRGPPPHRQMAHVTAAKAKGCFGQRPASVTINPDRERLAPTIVGM